MSAWKSNVPHRKSGRDAASGAVSAHLGARFTPQSHG